MPNRELRDERQSADDTGRPKVGPADPETRRRMLKERLAEREPNRYGKGEKPEAAKPKTPDQDTGNLSVFSVGRKIRGARVRREEEAGNP